MHFDPGLGGDSGEALLDTAGGAVVSLSITYGQDQNLFHDLLGTGRFEKSGGKFNGYFGAAK